MARVVCRGRVRRGLATPARAAGAGPGRASSDRPTPIRQIGPVRAAPDQTPARSAAQAGGVCAAWKSPPSSRPASRASVAGSPVVSSSRAPHPPSACRSRSRSWWRSQRATGAPVSNGTEGPATAGWPRPGREMGAAQHQHVGAGLARSSRTGASTAARRAGPSSSPRSTGRPTRGRAAAGCAPRALHALHQGGELAAGQRAGGGEHADHAAGGQVGGGLDGWLHADHDQSRGGARAGRRWPRPWPCCEPPRWPWRRARRSSPRWFLRVAARNPWFSP